MKFYSQTAYQEAQTKRFLVVSPDGYVQKISDNADVISKFIQQSTGASVASRGGFKVIDQRGKKS